MYLYPKANFRTFVGNRKTRSGNQWYGKCTGAVASYSTLKQLWTASEGFAVVDQSRTAQADKYYFRLCDVSMAWAFEKSLFIEDLLTNLTTHLTKKYLKSPSFAKIFSSLIFVVHFIVFWGVSDTKIEVRSTVLLTLYSCMTQCALGTGMLSTQNDCRCPSLPWRPPKAKAPRPWLTTSVTFQLVDNTVKGWLHEQYSSYNPFPNLLYDPYINTFIDRVQNVREKIKSLHAKHSILYVVYIAIYLYVVYIAIPRCTGQRILMCVTFLATRG